MPLRIATWNINSVRRRLGLLTQFLEEVRPDLLCLQETKCPDDRFPLKAFRELGYPHVALNGQKGWHGVAILSRRPFIGVDKHDFCARGDARHVGISLPVNGAVVRLHSLYVPAGGDEPDPQVNPRFAHKLAFLEEMGGWLADGACAAPAILVGDLNVAPLEHDVWSHRQLLRIVSHTPVEVERLEAARAAGGLVDVMRRFVPETEKLYTWWSYRAADWRVSNRGRRLDHVWASPDVAALASEMRVYADARDWECPSDHVPVVVDFMLG